MEQVQFVTNRVDLSNIARFILRKWFIVAVTAVLCAFAGFIYSSFFITPLYKAESTVLFDLRNSKYDNISYEDINIATQYISTCTYLVKTDSVLNPVIEQLDLDESVSSLSSKVSVSEMEDTFLIKISVKYHDKEMAKKIVSAIDKTLPEVFAERITAGNIGEIDSPKVTSSPISPNVTKYTLTGCAVGIVISAMLLAVICMLNNRINSIKELTEAVNLPVLGILPDITKTGKKSKGA